MNFGDDYFIGAYFEDFCVTKFAYAYFYFMHFTTDGVTGSTGLDQCLLHGMPYSVYLTSDLLPDTDCLYKSCMKKTGEIYSVFSYCFREDAEEDCKAICNPNDESKCLYCHDSISCDIIDSM